MIWLVIGFLATTLIDHIVNAGNIPTRESSRGPLGLGSTKR